MSSPAGAKRLVIGSLALAGVIAAAGDMVGGEAPQLRIFIGAIVAGTLLAVTAEVAPDLAAALAVLVLVTTAVGGGPPVAKKVAAITDPARKGQK